MKTRTILKIMLAAALSLAVARAEDKADVYDVLAVHKTEATFKGTREHRCMGRTSMCPDRCGDSGTMATFVIDKYTHFKKPGEYGDDKQETFQFLVEDNLKNAKVPARIVAKINSLKPGDRVVLEWEHRYMNRAGSRWPERPVTKLEKLP